MKKEEKKPKKKRTIVKKLKLKSDKKEVDTKKIESEVFNNVEENYFEAVGRRKTSTARVRIFPVNKREFFLVNGKDVNIYFPTQELQKVTYEALEKVNVANNFNISVLVKGGGINSQAEAVRHGIARGLVLFNSSFRTILKKAGFLTRDPRMRERKKFGLKRARRAPQWQKR